jgi:prolipoprotein diacylglyceryltransferase
MEFTLLANAAIAAGAGWLMLWWEARRGNASRCGGNLWETALVAAVAGVLGGRLVAMLVAGVAPWSHPLDILVVRGGVSTAGAAVTACVVYLVLARREPLAMADGISAAALAALAGWHGGCVTRAACLGTPSDVPWAVAQAGSTVTRHPVEIYSALLLGVAAVAIALWKAHGRPRPGVPAGLATSAAGGIALLTEPMRASLSGGPMWFYATATLAGLVAVATFSLSGRARRHGRERPGGRPHRRRRTTNRR